MSSRSTRDRPNILVVMADQLTPFALGCYGNPVVKSPEIDRLADQGVPRPRDSCEHADHAVRRRELGSQRRETRAHAGLTVDIRAARFRRLGECDSIAPISLIVATSDSCGSTEWTFSRRWPNQWRRGSRNAAIRWRYPNPPPAG